MKIVRTWVAMSVLCFTLCAGAAICWATAGEREGVNSASRLVRSILNVDIVVEESDPPNLVVTVNAEIPGAKHDNVRLVRAVYCAPPRDGIQDYYLCGVSSSDAACQVTSKVQASNTWKAYSQTASWLNGIRVHGTDGRVVVVMLRK